jgi:hypothetical protein
MGFVDRARWRRGAEPDEEGPWTVVFCTRVRSRVGRQEGEEVTWNWLGNRQFATMKEARKHAQELQDGRSRIGDEKVMWAYARLADALTVDRRVPPVEVQRWVP